MAASIVMRLPCRNILRNGILISRCSILSHGKHTYEVRDTFHLPNKSIQQKVSNQRREISIHSALYNIGTADVQEETEKEIYHSIIKDTERSKGEAKTLDFQAETKKLLDIVAHSLYSEKEVFIRELISNSSDALEKLRYQQSVGAEVFGAGNELEIHIATNEDKKTLIIQDTGIGMTKEEVIENLGTIAKSGTKGFLEELQNQQEGNVNNNIIGQFGVGFYSSFMVGDRVDVYTRSFKPDAKPLKWSSDGLGSYEISEAESVDRGTKIVIHLKGECYDYAKEEVIKDIVTKYSNYVGVPIYLNGMKVNVVEALWMKDIRDVTSEQHEQFYKFIAKAHDNPRYWLHYKTDAPLNIRALFYVPEYKPLLYDMSQEKDVEIALYSKKVMIMSKANHIIPRWLRFMKGVVDSEDIPLNLSRELLQDSSLIRKIRWVLTNRILKFLLERAKKDQEKYLKFHDDFGMYFREGILTTPEQEQREEISKLLRFESSALAPKEMTSIEDYVSRMKTGSKIIYYLSAPTRELAESSPYMEAMKKSDSEVLFLNERYDELVLMNLGQFGGKQLKSVENELTEDTSSQKRETVDSSNEQSLNQIDADDLTNWLQIILGNKVHKTKVTTRLVSHPCIITVPEMGAARHFLKTTLADRSEEEKFKLLQPTLEVNPANPIIKKLHSLKSTDPDLAKLVAYQMFDNALIAAGLVEDPRTMLLRMNELLEKALAKH